jgi:hypothetical protein
VSLGEGKVAIQSRMSWWSVMTKRCLNRFGDEGERRCLNRTSYSGRKGRRQSSTEFDRDGLRFVLCYEDVRIEGKGQSSQEMYKGKKDKEPR